MRPEKEGYVYGCRRQDKEAPSGAFFFGTNQGIIYAVFSWGERTMAAKIYPSFPKPNPRFPPDFTTATPHNPSSLPQNATSAPTLGHNSKRGETGRFLSASISSGPRTSLPKY